MLRCGATFQCPRGAGSSTAPAPAPARLVIYALFLKPFWESVKTEPGAGASPLESFCSRQDSALDNFGTGWRQGRGGTSVPGCCTVWKAETNSALSSLPPTAPARPWKTAGRHWVVGKAAGPSCGPREKEGLWHQISQGWDICEVQTGIDSSPGSSPCWGFPTGQLPSLRATGMCFRSYILTPMLFSHLEPLQ